MSEWVVVQMKGIRTIEADTAREALDKLIATGSIQGPPPMHVERVCLAPVDQLETFDLYPGTPRVGDKPRTGDKP